MSDKAIWEFTDITCPICHHDEFDVVGFRGGDAHHDGKGERTRIVRCCYCSHQYPNPMPFPTVGLDEIYVDPDEYFSRHDLEAKKFNGRKLVREFERRLGKKGDFLDVGCGRGELIWAANEEGWNYEGIDPSKQFIDFARMELGVEGRVATLNEAGFESESFDAVALSGILEHLYDPVDVMSEVHRILRPGGWVFLDAPNEDGLYMKVGNAYMQARRKDWVVVLAPTFAPFHVQGFNPKSLSYLLEAVGFAARELSIAGETSPQTGKSTLRKSAEYNIARFINWLGKLTGKGMYMHVWAQKSEL